MVVSIGPLSCEKGNKNPELQLNRMITKWQSLKINNWGFLTSKQIEDALLYHYGWIL